MASTKSFRLILHGIWEWKQVTQSCRSTRLILTRCALRRKVAVLSESFCIWDLALDTAKEHRRAAHISAKQERRFTKMAQTRAEKHSVALKRVCLQRWEQAILKVETIRSRAQRLDKLLVDSHAVVGGAFVLHCLLVWSRVASLARMRKNGVKRAKRKWLGYTTRAVLSSFWDRWRDDAESERISRQVLARSMLVGSRKLRARQLAAWKMQVVCKHKDRKREAVLSFRCRKQDLRHKELIVPEWRALASAQCWWRRLKARLLSRYLRGLNRRTFVGWHASAYSQLSGSRMLGFVWVMRGRSSKRELLRSWRGFVYAVRSLSKQVYHLRFSLMFWKPPPCVVQ
jgi:hypothetical protein